MNNEVLQYLFSTLSAFLVASALSFLPKTSANMLSASILACTIAFSTFAVGSLPCSFLSISYLRENESLFVSRFPVWCLFLFQTDLVRMLFSVSSWSMIDPTLALMKLIWLSFSPSTWKTRNTKVKLLTRKVDL